MLSQISWSSYFQFLALLLVIYYGVIFLYFRKQVFIPQNAFHPGTRRQWTPTAAAMPAETKEIQNVKPQEGTVDVMIQDLLDETKAYLSAAGEQGLSKEEIVVSLRRLIDKYPAIKESAFCEDLQHMITEFCQTYCSVQLSETDAAGLWL